MTADLLALTDVVAVCRFQRMTLQAKALRAQDRDPETAQLAAFGSEVAGRLADETAEVLIFKWATRGPERA